MSPRVGSTIDEARSLVERRLQELDDERGRLERALADLSDGAGGRSGRSRGGRRRRRRGGTRAEQAVKIIRDNPGITASEIARRINIKPNYMYRVMGEL